MCRRSAVTALLVCCAAAGQVLPVSEGDDVVPVDSLSISGSWLQARIGGWRIDGDSVVAEGRLLRLLPGRGTAFSRTAVDRAAAAILLAHENNGYPFCGVAPLALTEESGFVYPVFQVEAGPKVDVGFLEFAGKSGTSPVLLERTAGFSRGTYSRASTAIWRQRLDQSGLVTVDSEAIVRTADAYGVRFWVTGRRVNSASGIAGYSPEDRRLTGLVQVSFHNLFDSGRRLEAGWKSAYAKTSYHLSYTEPWLFGTAVGVTASARQETVDTTSAQTKLALSADVRAATWTTLSFGTGYDRYTSALSRTSVSVAWVGTGVVLDSRDFPANPRSGVRLSAMTKVGKRSTDSAHTDAVAQVEFGLNDVLPLGQSLAWSNSVGLRTVYSAGTLTESELYTLGGPGTVRGYREDEFFSTSVGWYSTELRYRLDRTSSVYPFLDAGVYRDSLGWQVKPGYGAGTRVATRVGVLGLAYGVAFPGSPMRGKVHLSYDVVF